MRHLAATILAMTFLTSSFTHAEDIFGLTASSKLVRFDSANPGLIISNVAITGLQASETIVGIDFRPNTGQLYGIGSTSRVYVINVVSGVATQVGAAAFIPLLAGVHYGVDFNPTADRIRSLGDAGQSLRLNPDSGVATTDTTLAYAAFDPSFSIAPHIVSAAYSNNVATSTVTTLFAIDSTQATLVTVGTINGGVSPNSGLVFTIGKLGVAPQDVGVGFDISGASGVAYAAMTLAGDSTTTLCTINLNSGTTKKVGTIAAGELVVDIAVLPAPTPFDTVALRNNGTLVRFNAATPGVTPNVSTTVTGLTAGDSLTAIDFRPSTGVLFGLGVGGGAANTSRIYTIDPESGVAAQVTPAATPITLTNSANAQGFRFNPVADRIRIMNEDKQNMAINPDTGVVSSADTALTYNAADANKAMAIDINTIMYTNAANGATTLFGLDRTTNNLISVNTPFSGGVISTVGSTTQTLNQFSSLAQAPGGTVFAAINNNLYTVNLTTGAAVQVGTVGIGGGNIRSIAAVPATAQQFVQISAANFQVVEGSVGAITVSRIGSTNGIVSVDYAVTSGTAIAGTHFTSVSGTLTFLNGEASRTILVPTLNDNTLDLFLTANVTLSNPIGAKLGAQATGTLTIADINDLDGDGFTNDIEAAAGTNPNDATSTPFGGQAAGATQPLTVTKTSVKLNFAKTTLMDSVSFGGTIPNPLVTIPAGTQVIAEMGDVNGKSGVIQVFTFDASGKSTPKGLTIGKPKSGVSSFSVVLSKGTFAAQLANAKLTNQTVSKLTLPLNFNLYFNKIEYAATKNITYTATTGKSGSASLAK